MHSEETEPRELKGWMPLIIVGLIVGVFAYLMARGKDHGGRMPAPRTPSYATPAANVGSTPVRYSIPGPPPTPAAQAIESLALGMGYLQMPGYEIKAEAAFTDAAVQNPGNAKAWLALGWARLNNGRRFSDAAFADLRFKLAQEAFDNCLRIDPHNQSAHLGAGQLAMMDRRFDEAERYLLQATGDPEAWLALLKLYLLQERFDDAQRWNSIVLECRPNDPYVKMMAAAVMSRNLQSPLKDYLEAELLPRTSTQANLEAQWDNLLQSLEPVRSWLEGQWNGLGHGTNDPEEREE